jgi:hypothetical protein
MTGPLGFPPSLPSVPHGVERTVRSTPSPAPEAKPVASNPELFRAAEVPQSPLSNEALAELDGLMSTQPVSAHVAQLDALMPIAQPGDETLTRADVDAATDVLVQIETRFPCDEQRNILLQLAEQLRPDTQAQSLIQAFQSLSASLA